ncbi:MAG: tetratricopeptide repeat protein [Pseudomonas sp.]|uniref:tetratricopeptide repeat protein n=1 Tax=Pseudomonas sp. TaxID=306 RepID=UPI002732866C|nr:tetratricopeptide repeat protein [Pseudomonas sp.]MDP3847731.1 tetratricopeptide repeat protein [Pseudomonas sp.]
MPATRLSLTLALALALISPALLAGFDEAAAALAAGNYAQAQAELGPLLEKSDPRAQYSMGVLYENGFGVTKDLPLAAAWYLKAADQGDIDALNNLGALYQNGRGVAQDKVLAMALYNLSVAYAGKALVPAVGNRQDLANQMPLEEVKKSLTLTQELFKPDNIKAGLEAYLRQQGH